MREGRKKNAGEANEGVSGGDVKRKRNRISKRRKSRGYIRYRSKVRLQFLV